MKEPTKFIYDISKSVEVETNYIIDNYISKDDNIGYSVVRSHLNGSHPWMKNISSNRTYYLIEGSARFSFEDKIIELNKGEMLTIPKNTKYSFIGKFDAILIDCPAFNPDDDVIYDE